MSEPKLNCSETFMRLDDYLDRELTAGEMKAVEGHLAQCAACAGEFGVEKELLDGIRARLGRLRMPEALKAKIFASLDRS